MSKKSKDVPSHSEAIASFYPPAPRPDPLLLRQAIDMMLSFCGVRGFPVFAWMRTFRPTEYDVWLNNLPEN